MAAEGKPDWMWDEEELNAASPDNRIQYLLELQEQIQRYEQDIEELRELVYFMLDLQSGFTAKYESERDEETVVPADN